MANKFVQIVFAMLWLILGIVLMVNTWSWFLYIGTSIIIDDVFQIIYWAGYIGITITCTFLPPFVLIINAYKEDS